MKDTRITEQRNPRTEAIDLASAEEIVDLLNAEDATVAAAVRTQRGAIAAAITAAEQTLQSGGRVFYVGAGTSGRLGVLDASEIPPTFGAPPDKFQGIIAGGHAALTRSQEGAEDRPAGARDDLDQAGVRATDFVIGIAASGTTPYVRAALVHARTIHAKTAIIACSPPPAETVALADIAIVVVTGPEAVTGSTRLKAGTATKMVLNMISTGAMIRLGKTYGNLMVDLLATNEKLLDRSERIVAELCDGDRQMARTLLMQSGGVVKVAIVMHLLSISRADAEKALERVGGVVRAATHMSPPRVK